MLNPIIYSLTNKEVTKAEGKTGEIQISQVVSILFFLKSKEHRTVDNLCLGGSQLRYLTLWPKPQLV
ncbi:hypothetical protein UY3_01098 [Chelonia mydas]|uniref:Uncharacterized protein n=1 Tax=Chelonia mydas TaxID=8469 RepID=M7BUY8_CHEMY|nr:hypothetical protein UY3_01098 [Chelonia mydas]